MSTKNNELSDVVSDAKSRMSNDMESLMDAFSQLRKDVMHVVADAAAVGKSNAVGVVNNASAHLDDLTDLGARQYRAMEKRIENHPVATAAIAVGVGILIASIMTYRGVRTHGRH